MNAKNSLCILIDALAELGGKAERSLLVNLVLGIETQAIKQNDLQESELFGCGDEHDDEHYNNVIDEALRQKLITQKGDLLSASAKGKKLVKDSEAEFRISGDDDDDETSTPASLPTEDIALEIETPQPQQETVGAHTRLKIQLIQAIDRKIALDDFAKQQNLDFDEVLNQVEVLKKSGRKIDLTYFIQDVLDPEDIQELNDSFESNKGKLDASIREMEDVYSPEEIRLAYIQWKK